MTINKENLVGYRKLYAAMILAAVRDVLRGRKAQLMLKQWEPFEDAAIQRDKWKLQDKRLVWVNDWCRRLRERITHGEQAEKWIMSDDEQYITNFRVLCQLAHIDYKSVRQRLGLLDYDSFQAISGAVYCHCRRDSQQTST